MCFGMMGNRMNVNDCYDGQPRGWSVGYDGGDRRLEVGL
jgi:hypothetical protein